MAWHPLGDAAGRAGAAAGAVIGGAAVSGLRGRCATHRRGSPAAGLGLTNVEPADMAPLCLQSFPLPPAAATARGRARDGDTGSAGFPSAAKATPSSPAQPGAVAAGARV